MKTLALGSGWVDVNRAEIDARTIYDLFSIREESIGATREDVEAKAIALRNFNFVSAVVELIAADEALPQVKALVDAVKYVRAPGWLLTREGIKKLEAAIQPFL